MSAVGRAMQSQGRQRAHARGEGAGNLGRACRHGQKLWGNMVAGLPVSSSKCLHARQSLSSAFVSGGLSLSVSPVTGGTHAVAPPSRAGVPQWWSGLPCLPAGGWTRRIRRRRLGDKALHARELERLGQVWCSRAPVSGPATTARHGLCAGRQNATPWLAAAQAMAGALLVA